MSQLDQSTLSRRAGIEARTQKRYRCREKKLLRFAIRPTFRNHVALINDVSVNGIGFLINEPLEAGAVLALQLRGGIPGVSMIRTARVMHVRKHLPIPD